jgi:hypothetical protein
MARRRELSYKQRRTKAQREADNARKAERRGLLATPSSARGRGAWQRFLPDTEEVRFLTRAARSVSLDPRADPRDNPYLQELQAIGRKAYRAAYGQQQARRRSAGTLKARAKGAWIRVKAHRRRRPGGGS